MTVRKSKRVRGGWSLHDGVALVAGWDRALDEILTELVSDLKAVR